MRAQAKTLKTKCFEENASVPLVQEQNVHDTETDQSGSDTEGAMSEHSDVTEVISKTVVSTIKSATRNGEIKQRNDTADRNAVQARDVRQSYRYISQRLENFSAVFLGLLVGLLLVALGLNFVNKAPFQDTLPSISRQFSRTDLRKDCAGHDIFAVMGKTGVGKSTFIERLGGRNKYGNLPEISGSIESCTTTTTYYQTTIDNKTVCFLDTPGFDDSTGITVQQTFNQLWEALPQSQLARGLLYFHDVTPVRVGGLSVELFKMFGDLCGESQIDRVVLVPVSSRQNPTKEEMAQESRHLREVQDKYWKSMRLEGSRTMPFNHSRESDSALRIIRHLTELPKRRPSQATERPHQQNQPTMATLSEHLKYLSQAHHGIQVLKFTKSCLLEARKYGGAVLGF